MRIKSKSWMGMLVMVILIISLLTFGCSTATTQAPATVTKTTTQVATATATATATTTAVATATATATITGTAPTTAAGGAQILKIGFIDNFAFASGIDVIHIMDVYNDIYKDAGGLVIGGKQYQMQFVPYDNQNVQATAMSALNKLIFEDKAKYIITGFTPLSDGWLPVTEQNKVIFVNGGVTPPTYDPKYNYCFEAGGLPCMATGGPYWFAKNFPNMKDVVIAGPDNQMGHMGNDDATRIMTYSGMKVKEIFYPATSSDLSSLGTQVKLLNPPVVVCQGGGPLVDSLAQKAIYQAGWRGQFFTAPASTALNMQQVVPPEVLEGQIVGAVPCEFDPPLNDAAKEFKTRWIAKYGKYEGQTLGNLEWDAIRAAMQTAGSIDVDAVAKALHNGQKYSGVQGDCQMVPRRDFGDDRTTGSATTLYMKKIVKGAPILIGTFTLQEAVALMNAYYVKK
jgi:branched-chain amino acid transport system substrate-binding protein